ncbi:hypothetical protein GLYMA_02G139100v4 [Glycine max]|uniref:Uncharacterized protein n=2 Tax=Glycine subgen. Soja TaxID=1462606 RepID=K7K893_SOYBN|nr:hypothetical protein JHK87_003943 [Glycine soja]KAH1060247.1 hypothetical protein GYH30_003960 [Glycine max]KRH71284.1 hypothetical protein GLYMA_02G139100v4 [Glycine max]RZC24895.1 hypothetical protein D0Y65_003868 [Glycine soja]
MVVMLSYNFCKFVEKNKIYKHKDKFCRKIISDGLLTLRYDASICKSCWEKSPLYPVGIVIYLFHFLLVVMNLN